MLEGYSDLFIKTVKGPNTSILYHIRCGLFFDVNDGSRYVHMSVFDINDNPINKDVRKVMTEAQFIELLQDKIALENAINLLITQCGV